ncbi:MutS-related protein [Sphingobacterium sp. SGG-5]|uniref:MutS-related protein n=1 Tax=Sphingobacterium sp. SGG-5 TaxID=2710881 RepID=UPI001F0E3E04|nr:DNA mismatch repair protein MutS [Sphingobacterium sp. SGG-5]
MRAIYTNNVRIKKEEIAVLEKKINTNSIFRLVTIVVGGALLFQVFQWNNIWILLATVLAIVLGFVALVRRQSVLEKQLHGKQALLRVNQNELDLMDSGDNMYEDGNQFDDPKHPYVSDLDVFGSSSLFAKVNRAATSSGVVRLATWFLSSSTKEMVEKRQLAAEELSTKMEWCQEFQSRLLFNLNQKADIKAFLSNYLKEEGLKFGNTFMRLYVPFAPFLVLGSLLVSIFFYPIWGYIAGLGVLHLLWTMGLGGKVSFFSNRIDKIGNTLIAYSDAIKLVEREQFDAALNADLQQRLHTKKEHVLSDAFKELGTLIDKLDARNNLLVGALLNMIFLWDFRQVLAIMKWKENYGVNVLESFDTIAKVEALVSLATLRRNNPTWSKPVIVDDVSSGRIYAEAINHPLIIEEKAVANDYDAGQHQIALITGSNMAGKSTFLRTVGLNAVLAYAGAVVCATKLHLPIYRLVTYMRIKDNLSESTSTFKAEIDRMKFILGTIEVTDDSYFLIDEMLRGTNSVDKYLGSKAIIKKLIEMEGKGMVATHDLQLASLEDEYPTLIKNFHFDIQVADGEMLFDYKLKNGKCTVFNASMLLKGIGIDVGVLRVDHTD